NPVAVMVTFYFFARDALLRLMGTNATELIQVPAIASHAIKKRLGRTEYQRGIIETNALGKLQVSTTGAQGSGVLRSMSLANCMIVLDDDMSDVAVGQEVQCLLFDGLL
ncbi:MAG: molybdopterin molybdenumtransferase MoeA, partial [Undibacterium sp.]|nr:molybdopterin molybdenumtransferase MoeA [Undibacterium sp.]